MSCGTGVTASALVCAHNDNGFNRVEVKTPGGRLSVEFEKLNENQFMCIKRSVKFDLAEKQGIIDAARAVIGLFRYLLAD